MEQQSCSHLRRYQIIEECSHSRSQLYEWIGFMEREGSVPERKPRKKKELDPETVIHASEMILRYPHMGGEKGQAYMIYHRLGLIGQKAYEGVKKVVKTLVFQEVSRRKLLPERTSYEHEIPQKVNEAWAEDFTQVQVYGVTLYISLVIDVRSTYYLGAHADRRAGYELVAEPIHQALALTEGQGPEWFILSDHGKQYNSERHELLLRTFDIVHKLIPAAKPQFNGSMECGVKEFKNVFYELWAKYEQDSDKEKNLLERVRFVVKETAHVMNTDIPRPCLQGVTPHDAYMGCDAGKRMVNRLYVQEQKERTEFPPWKKGFWQTIKEAIGLEQMGQYELMTSYIFFGRRPLRQITKFAGQAVG